MKFTHKAGITRNLEPTSALLVLKLLATDLAQIIAGEANHLAAMRAPDNVVTAIHANLSCRDNFLVSPP